MAWRGLTKQQWAAIRVHLPEPKVSRRGGRPRVDDRRCFEGILWLLWPGAQWSELPRRYGKPLDLLAAAQAVGRERGAAQAVAGFLGPTQRPAKDSLG